MTLPPWKDIELRPATRLDPDPLRPQATDEPEYVRLFSEENMRRYNSGQSKRRITHEYVAYLRDIGASEDLIDFAARQVDHSHVIRWPLYVAIAVVAAVVVWWWRL